MATKIQKKDWEKAEQFIQDELASRKSNPFRKKHEQRWTEVDRQVQMEALSRVAKGKESTDWRAAIELGELSKASEVLSADIRRMSFPPDWFDIHSNIEGEFNPQTGERMVDPRMQSATDSRVKALMHQQHGDFGLKGRVDLSVKEALHHGSYVCEVRRESMMMVDKGMVTTKSAPAWIPHSMWNCYPDSSPSITGTNLFYPGSMVIESYTPLYKVKRWNGDGYMSANFDQIPKSNAGREGEDKDCQILSFFGDLVIERSGEDIFLPNCKVMLANGRIIYYKENDLPFPQIIYNGWERLDVRDPYYVSPLVKMSPTQRSASIMASRLIDAVDLETEPPGEYDATNPTYIMNGGPTLHPGSMNPNNGSNSIKMLEVGNSAAALSATQWYTQELRSGTGVAGQRQGVADTSRQTAHEIETLKQSGEIRTVDFVDKHETNGLRPFLYMQHELNKRELEAYSFYNNDPGAPDFDSMSKEDLPQKMEIDVIGTKTTVNEAQKQQKFLNSVQLASANPLLAPRLNPDAIIQEMFMDSGKKNPERFIGGDALKQQFDEQMQQAVGQIKDQAQQHIATLESEIAKLEQELASQQANAEEQDLRDVEKDIRQTEEIQRLKTDINALQHDMKVQSGIHAMSSMAQRNAGVPDSN